MNKVFFDVSEIDLQYQSCFYFLNYNKKSSRFSSSYLTNVYLLRRNDYSYSIHYYLLSSGRKVCILAENNYNTNYPHPQYIIHFVKYFYKIYLIHLKRQVLPLVAYFALWYSPVYVR